MAKISNKNFADRLSFPKVHRQYHATEEFKFQRQFIFFFHGAGIKTKNSTSETKRGAGSTIACGFGEKTAS
jgi:hypothetical protein